ncbi:MAG: hypothetical protein HOV81_36865 [Kofleriaceae bacterium]|nr:hypothetical protein [Kofleriaceae bacterium]
MSIKSILAPWLVLGVIATGLSGCVDPGGDDEVSSSEQFIAAPTNVTATALSNSQISVSWSAVANTRKYYVYQAVGAGPFAYAGTVLAPATSRTFTNLMAATTYSYQIVAVDLDSSESVPSATASATTFGDNFGAPTNVTAMATSTTSITVNWSAVANARKYYIYQALGMNGTYNYAGTILVPGTSRVVQNLAANTQYCFRLQTEFTNGTQSGMSTPACATTTTNPGAPTGLSATAISDTRINLQWTGVSGATKYYVYRSAAGGVAPYTAAGTAVAPATQFVSVNLMPNTKYCFRASSVSSTNVESAQSGAVCATTFATGGGGYRGFWKFDEGTGTIARDATGLERHGTLAGGATFSTTDKPQIDDNRSALSVPATASAVVTFPLTSSLDLVGSFTVAFWARVPTAGDVRFLGMRQAGCGAAAYEIAQDSTNGLHFLGENNQIVSFGSSLPVGEWTHVSVTNGGGVMRLYLDGVQVASAPYVATNNVQTQMQVGHVAGCAGGAFLMDQLAVYGRALSAAEIATLGTTPAAPTNLVVTSKTARSIDLAWDPVPGATAYIISKGTGPGNETFLTHSPAQSPTFRADHLEIGTQYSFTVRAVVDGLYSDASNEVVDSTNPAPPAPTGLTATALTSSRIQVAWSSVPTATKYYVYMSTSNGPFVLAASVVAPATDRIIVNLTPNTMYSFQVQTEDASQTKGPFSTSVSATTPSM